MIILKSPREIELMRQAGAVTGQILRDLTAFIQPGISTADVDQFVSRAISSSGMIAAFKGYNGYPASACVSVNQEVVHGIPNPRRKLKEGDIVSVDLGTIYEGYYSDAARTYPVGKIDQAAQKLIDTTEASFFAGLRFCRSGCRLSDVAHAIQEFVEAEGFSVVRDYVGHGIGQAMHEAPQIPNYGTAGHGPELRPGMVLAIEPMVNEGGWQVETLSDNWTVVTKDGRRSAHYENTVVITEDEPLLLTVAEPGETDRASR